ncbi:hypothetical protein CDL12_04736 [Handroanthus impetiginosus]|uniref:C2H2-type domain-containing protein n=1 Tax=Handroanthus impetiginosus TaxID=429701 RepID=A0A2G9HYJ0_9LAMI|nr:hypothetical protein CDL12_04736 [Handroanthus impetiginosus]
MTRHEEIKKIKEIVVMEYWLRIRKKKSGAKDQTKDESGKVYECRFCSLKFCKSQALGGHMNRHRQERETETLNKARQLVFTNDLAPAAHLSYVSGSGQPISHGGYHQGSNMGDPPLPFRSMYSTRLFPSSSPLIPPPPPPPPPQSHPQVPPYNIYTSPQRLLSFSSSQYPPVNDYFVGHVLPQTESNNYTCIGAPVGHGFMNGGAGGGVRDVSLQNEEEGVKWGRR